MVKVEMRNKLNRIKEKVESFLLLGLVNTLRKKKVFVLQFSALIKKKKKKKKIILIKKAPD
jgi:hypothetical protein